MRYLPFLVLVLMIGCGGEVTSEAPETKDVPDVEVVVSAEAELDGYRIFNGMMEGTLNDQIWSGPTTVLDANHDGGGTMLTLITETDNGAAMIGVQISTRLDDPRLHEQFGRYVLLDMTADEAQFELNTDVNTERLENEDSIIGGGLSCSGSVPYHWTYDVGASGLIMETSKGADGNTILDLTMTFDYPYANISDVMSTRLILQPIR